MQRSRRRQRRAEKQKPLVDYRVNEAIRALEVFVINGDGEQLGVMPTQKAVALAKEHGYDLIEVGPKAQPPVARFGDFGQLQYEAKKKFQKQKIHQKKVEVKGVRISVRISSHDRDLRLRQAYKFLSQGNKVKVELILHGREHIHKDLARNAVKNFISDLKEFIKNPQEETMDRPPAAIEIEQDVTSQGSKLFAILKPASASSDESSE